MVAKTDDEIYILSIIKDYSEKEEFSLTQC